MPDDDAAAWLAGTADRKTLRRLAGRAAGDADLARELADQALVHRLLQPGPPAGLVAAQAIALARAPAPIVPMVRRRSWPMALAAGLACAAGVAIAIGVWFPSGDRGRGPLTIAGDATIRSGEGNAVHLRGPGPGDRITAGPAGASLGLADGTRLGLDAGTELEIAPATDGRFLIHAGGVSASVAAQAPGRRLVIAGPRLESRVVGTRFTMTVGPGGDLVSVDEGAVEVADAHGGVRRIGPGGSAASGPDGRLAAQAPAYEFFVIAPHPPGLPRHAGQLLRQPEFHRWAPTSRRMRETTVLAQSGIWHSGWTASLWNPGAEGLFTISTPEGGSETGMCLEPLSGPPGMQLYQVGQQPVGAGATLAVSVEYAMDRRMHAVLEVRFPGTLRRSRSVTLPSEPGGWQRWDGILPGPTRAGPVGVYVQHRSAAGRLWIRSLALSPATDPGQAGF